MHWDAVFEQSVVWGTPLFNNQAPVRSQTTKLNII